MSVIGKAFKKDSKDIVKHLKEINEDDVITVEAELQSKG